MKKTHFIYIHIMGKKLSGSFMHIDKVSHYHVVKFAKKNYPCDWINRWNDNGYRVDFFFHWFFLLYNPYINVLSIWFNGTLGLIIEKSIIFKKKWKKEKSIFLSKKLKNWWISKTIFFLNYSKNTIIIVKIS